MADMWQRDYLKNAQRLAYRDGPANASGQFQRVSLYRTDMKYPLIRVEESRAPGPNGTEVVLSQQAAVADHIMVRLQPGASEDDINQLAAQNGASVVKTPQPGLYFVQIPNADIDSLPHAIQTFSQYTGVLKYAEADSLVHASLAPNDPDFGGQWGLNNTGQTSGTPHADIDATDAWAIVNQSPNVLVAVIDSGIDFNHPDLQPNIWTNPNPGRYGYPNDLHGWNFYANTNSPQDDFFHGTHCSGTIGAVGSNSLGVTGVTWHVKLLPLKFLDSEGSGYTSDAVNAISYATEVGAKIMSNSWGGGGYSQALKDAIDAANTAGILFVAAAGNDGTDTDTNPTYPADFTSANIISVAATDDNDQLASFSNYGTTSVQLAAPGVGILSTFPTVATAAMTQEGLPTSYGQISGTSMATPHVSGVAALALAQNPSLTVAQLRALLLQRVTQLPQLSGLVQTSGRLNAYDVVNSNWTPAGARLQTTGVAMNDSEGNNDGIPNPGEILDFIPTILNSGGVAVTNVTAQLVSNQTTATVLTGAINSGTVSAFQQIRPGPFRVQLSSTVTNNAVLTFDLVVTADGITAIHTPVSIVVTAPQGYSEATVNFACGAIKADPSRNLVYVIDQTNARVVAIDTGLGQVSAATALDTTPAPTPSPAGVANQIGQMAVSLDGTLLYVALTTQQEIQVFSLPTLAPLATLPVNFNPVSLATGVSGRLFASSTDGWGNLREVNPNSGATVTTFNKGSNQSFYEDALLRTNVAGTLLYAAETGLSGSSETIYQYNIGSGGETLQNTYQCPMENLQDFGIDETQNRIYTMNGGVYGVGVTDMTTGTDTTVWPFGSSYGAAVTFLSGDSVIYGASGDPYAGNIRKFNRTDGTPLGDFVVGKNGSPIAARGIAITPNGRILYVRTNSNAGSYIGIIGATSITVTNPPPPPPTPAAITLATVGFSDSEGNGDGVANPGEIISLTPTFRNTGGTAGTNVAVSLSPGSGATLLTPSGGNETLGTVAAGASATGPAPYRIQLASGLTDGTSINFTFTATWDTGQSKQFIYTQVIHTSVAVSQLASSLQFGEILADQQRDVVYVIDKRYLRLLIFNTDVGSITQAVPLGGLATVDGVPPAPGMMAESVDGSKLYVALPQSQVIQVFSLPDMTSQAQWSFSFQPESLATDALGRIYCTTNDASQKLVQIDGTSGAVLSQTGPGFASTPDNTGGNEVIPAILHRNAEGTELYGSQTGQIYRFSTTGTTPTAINTLAIPGGSTIYDYVLDEQAARFYVASYGSMSLVPLNGSATTTWPPSSAGCAAVSYIPGSNNVLAGFNYFSTTSQNLDIRKYAKADGSTAQDYTITNGTNNEFTYRGIATTPNGRTLFEMANWSGSAEDPSIDGYDYTLGMLGGSVNLDIPPGTPVGLLSTTVTDPAPGSNDDYVHPGQTVQIAPVFKNFTSSLMSAVSVTLTSLDPLGVVQAPSSNNIGNVASYVSFTPAPNFKVAISSSAPDGYQIKLNFTVSYNNGTQQTIPYSLFVDNPIKGEAQVNFAIGDMVADRTRDLAYVIDNTNNRILAIDTDLGSVSKSADLAAPAGSGQMAISYDGTRLYVPLTAAKQIEVFQLPGLTQTDIINLSFSPSSLTTLSDGKIYASTNLGNFSDYLYQIDPNSSTTVGPFGHSSFAFGGYDSPLLRANGSGTCLYAVQTGIEGNVPIDEYTTTGSGLPTLTHSYPFLDENTADIAIDETYRRIYASVGGLYGIDVTEMDTGVGNILWPYGAPYSNAICFLPGSNFVYGAAPDTLIRRFNRADGTPLADFPVVTGNWTIMNRGMVITANGNILYAEDQFTGSTSQGINSYYYKLGLIGKSSLTITPPTAAPAVYAGADITIHLSQAAALAATVTSSVTNVPVTWSEVGGPGGATINSASTGSDISFSAPGTYQIKGTATQGSLTGSDLINVIVLPDPTAVSVTAPVATLVPGGQSGAFTFTRTGSTTGSFTVNYTVSGSAQNGVDYTGALTGSATIPDGSSSVIIPITPTANAAHGTITATVASSANYVPGVSQAATVNIVVVQPYSEWSSNYSLVTAATAIPKNDGVPNLLKYLFDIDPTKPISGADLGALPTLGTNTSTSPGTTYLTLTYRQNSGMSGVTVGVETSDDLQTWTPVNPPDIFQQVGTDPTTGDPIMEIGVKTDGSKQQFLRLNVTQ